MSQKALPNRLHDWLHALPGVADHAEATRLHRRGGPKGPHPSLGKHPFHNPSSLHNPHPRHSPAAWHGREPRVLIGLQRAIAGLLARVGGQR